MITGNVVYVKREERRERSEERSERRILDTHH